VLVTANIGGTLSMALDGATPAASIVVAGASNVPVTKVKFTANTENFTINKLTVTTTPTYDRSITAVKLTYPDGTATGYLSNGVVTFNSLNWTIAKDASEGLTISADLNTITAGAQSNDNIKFAVICATAGNCEAVGQSSIVKGDDNAELDDITTGNTMYLRDTKPTVSTASRTSATGNITAPGWTEIGDFVVSADANHDLELGQIKFTLSTNSATWAADLGIADFKVYDTNNLSDNLNDGAHVGVTSTYATATKVFTLTWATSSRPVVAEGASRGYLLKIDTLSSATTGYAIDQGMTANPVLQVYIDSDASNASEVNANLAWADAAAGILINGYLVNDLPAYSNSRVYPIN
jgi:hypothetical protein